MAFQSFAYSSTNRRRTYAPTLPTTEKGEGPADALRAERFETKALCGKHSVVPPIERQTFMIRESRTRWNEIVTLLN